MDDFRTGTPQNDPRCDYNVAEFSSAPGRFWRNDVSSNERPVVLVVEDDWLLRLGLTDELGAEGWTVVEAESGETALEILKSGLTIDLLITDVRLGGRTTGWDVAEAWRGHIADLPVVYVSASPPHETRRVSGSIFLSKPCVIAELLKVSRRLCARR